MLPICYPHSLNQPTLVVGSYMFGAARGARAKQAELDPLLAAGMGAAPAGLARDPLLSNPAVEMGGTGTTGERGDVANDASDTTWSSSGAPGTGAAWGPIESDPREQGLNYLVLVETRRPGEFDFKSIFLL